LEELQARYPGEWTLPYFGIVPEQFGKDVRFNSLNTIDKGLFVLWCLGAWRRGGMVDNFPAGNANAIGLTLEAWNDLQSRLTGAGLLVVSTDTLSLLQPELREQYLQCLERGSSTLKD
jgi:hypothetical protein